MKKKMLAIPSLFVIGGLLGSGCIYSHRAAPAGGTADTVTTTRSVVVNQAPPAPQTEVATVAPSEKDVWISGNWTSQDGHWIWLPGHWELRPRVNAMWVPGHWDQVPGTAQWTWTLGYWE